MTNHYLRSTEHSLVPSSPKCEARGLLRNPLKVQSPKGPMPSYSGGPQTAFMPSNLRCSAEDGFMSDGSPG